MRWSGYGKREDNNMYIDVLGTKYTIEFKSEEEDKFLENCDGYCDKSSKRIVVATEREDSELDDYKSYQKQCIRHEIIHAYLFESGLGNNFKHPMWGHDETMVDWIALQFPKLQRTFEDVEAQMKAMEELDDKSNL